MKKKLWRPKPKPKPKVRNRKRKPRPKPISRYRRARNARKRRKTRVAKKRRLFKAKTTNRIAKSEEVKEPTEQELGPAEVPGKGLIHWIRRTAAEVAAEVDAAEEPQAVEAEETGDATAKAKADDTATGAPDAAKMVPAADSKINITS